MLIGFWCNSNNSLGVNLWPKNDKIKNVRECQKDHNREFEYDTNYNRFGFLGPKKRENSRTSFCLLYVMWF